MKSTTLYKIFTIFFVLSGKFLSAQILFSETFGSSLGACNATNGSNGNWIWTNNCSFSGSGGHSAPGSALFQGATCQFGNSANTVSGNLNTPTIAIGPSGAVLTFNYRLVNECGNNNSTCPYDILTFQISTNGGASFTNIMSSSGTPSGLTNNSAWVPVSYTLNAYSNQTIMIRFNFNSIDGAINAYDGVYIDDIIVTGNCFVNLTSLPGNSTVTPVLCSGNSLTLTTSAVSNFSWSTGATTSSIVVTPTANTSYSISATSSANCVSSASLNVVVNNGLPVLSVANTASASNGTCPNSPVVLTASGANTYTWLSSSMPVTNGVPFTPTTSSAFTVTGLNACGTTTAAISLSIHPLPTVSGVASQASLCSGSPVTLTGIGSAVSYSWNGNLSNPATIFPSATQNHTVVGTSVLGCTLAAAVPVTVVTTPQAAPIPNPPLICIGSSVTLSSSGATNYTWTAPSGTYNTASFIDTPTITSTYTLTKSNANCVNTQTVNVIVNNLPPVSAIVNPTIVCASKPATLNAAGAANFTWTSGPPTWSATGAQISVSPSVSTLYTVTASDGTCVNTTTIFLPTNPNPTITIVPSSTAICFGQTATLTASGAIGYNWTNTTIVTSPTSSAIVESPTISTLYSVVGENSFSCTTLANQVIVVHPNPTLTISSNKPMVCEGGAADFTVTGANTYQWDANAGNSTNNIVQVNPFTSTIYTVAGTYTTTQCSSTKTILTTVFLPTFAVNSPTSSCLGGTINLIASGATSYTWNGSQPFSQIAVSPPTETVYVVAATSISLGVSCISTRTVLVSIYNNPTITAVAERSMICRGETTDLTAAGAQTYVWNTNQTGDIVPVGPFNNATYTVTGTDQNGCLGTTTVTVRVSTCFGIDEINLSKSIDLRVFPNPTSGAFKVSAITDIQLSLYNELGQLIEKFSLSAENNRQLVISDLAAGIYFIVGNANDKLVTEKIVIAK